MLSDLTTNITPKNIPLVDVHQFMRLLRRGVPQHKAEEIAMQDWRDRYARACVASVAGQLLALRFDPERMLAIVTGWAAYEHGLDADEVRDTVEYVAERELQRRRGGVRHAS